MIPTGTGCVSVPLGHVSAMPEGIGGSDRECFGVIVVLLRVRVMRASVSAPEKQVRTGEKGRAAALLASLAWYATIGMRGHVQAQEVEESG